MISRVRGILERCTQQIQSFWVDIGPLIQSMQDIQKIWHKLSACIDVSEFLFMGV